MDPLNHGQLLKLALTSVQLLSENEWIADTTVVSYVI